MIQPYYLAYKKQYPDKKFKSYEYIDWISKKHSEFRVKEGLREGQPYTDRQREKFIIFINGVD